jgi:Zn-dependent peptidase ImmA (M78 family)
MSQSEQGKTVTVKKHTFDSITEAAKHFEVPLSTAARRLQSGWTPEQAFNLTPPPKKTVAKKAGAKSKATAKQKETSERKTQGRQKTLAIQTQGRKSLTAKDLASQRKSQKSNHKRVITFEGKEYPSVSELARSFNVPRHIIQNALSRNIDLSDVLKPKKKASTKKTTKKAAKAVKTPSKKTEASSGKLQRNNPVVFQGVKYASERALSAAYDVPHATFYQRMKRGWSMEEALGIANKKASSAGGKAQSPRATPLTANGKTYPSIKAAAETHNVPAYRVTQRLKHGWTPEQALGIHSREMKINTSAKMITCHGKKYKSVGEFCREYNLTPQHVSYHMQKGRTPEQILARRDKKSSPLMSIKDLAPFVVEGNSFETAAELARHYGMNAAKVTGRLRNGWSAAKSVDLNEEGTEGKTKATKPVKGSGKTTLIVDGKRYASVKSAARDLKLDYPTLLKRSKEDKPFSVVVYEMMGKKKTGRKSALQLTPEELIVKGKQYASLSDVAREFKIPYPRLRGRIQKGMSVPEAVSMKLYDRQPNETTDKVTSAHDASPEAPTKPVRHGLVQYDSITEFSTLFELDPIVVERRLDSGWSAEQILGESTPPNWS